MSGPVSASPLSRHTSSPTELAQRLEAQRRGEPHVIYRDHGGRQQIRVIAPGERELTIGRRQGSGVRVDFDDQVSRLHAALERVGGDWTIVDDGLSRNGTFVGGERLHGRRRLHDGDVIVVGRTSIAFLCPEEDSAQTASAVGPASCGSVSAADRCVLVALCRPLRDAPHALPASNQRIGDELHLSLPAVKKRLGSLFERFELEGLAQNEKRVALARAAIRSGVVRPGEL